ncbi:MAG: hypothetical protein PUH24_05750 [Prevotellaceae bacterium]|nr:hypothetical protein [Prevotella sp.]MDD7257758.1 hypothetical protein [Prevotellaceae bacterium]MDY6130507.1 hypothetical protein [Prevotella sp.]
MDKKRSFLMGVMVLLGICTTILSSCKDEVDFEQKVDNSWQQGNKINDMTQTRAFVLCEGSYNGNNASITYFDWSNGKIFDKDVFEFQNSKRIGDTGQDLIRVENNMFMTVYGSRYISKLTGAGVELTRTPVDKELGSPRFMTYHNGYLYTTTYGGFVAKYNASNLTYVSKVEVGKNPEEITELDGKLYLVNSGWGNDNRLSIIDTKTFEKAEHVEIFTNPQKIENVDGRLFVQGYGGKDTYNYQVGEFNPATKKYTFIATATNFVPANGKLYIVNSVTDWSNKPYKTTNYFSSYDLKTNKLTNENPFKNMPDELVSSSVFGMSANPYTGDIFVMTSDYVTNGYMYRFDKNGNFVATMPAQGVSPKKIVFFK